MRPREIFLSHSSTDQAFVRPLAETLRRHGLPVWYSATHILGAQQWHDEIGAALRRCDWMIVVLSPAAVDSLWVKRELCYALQQRQYLDRITPLLLKPCESDRLSWTLSALQSVDFFRDPERGHRELFRVWGIGYQV
jgi:hypothetical protein